MDFVSALWLPILLSALLVFSWSAITWMALPFRNNEWKGLPNHEVVRQAIKTAGFAPGQYMFPWWEDMKHRRSPEAMAKIAEGPSGFVTIRKPGPMNMGALMAQTLVFNIVVSFFCAYVASHALPIGASYAQVFRLVGAVGFLAYGFATIPDSIWFSKPWRSSLLTLVDGAVFGFLMGGAFGWLWPR
jgi:hypothetical protein